MNILRSIARMQRWARGHYWEVALLEAALNNLSRPSQDANDARRRLNDPWNVTCIMPSAIDDSPNISSGRQSLDKLRPHATLPLTMVVYLSRLDGSHGRHGQSSQRDPSSVSRFRGSKRDGRASCRFS
jgi:hypothetical protein